MDALTFVSPPSLRPCSSANDRVLILVVPLLIDSVAAVSSFSLIFTFVLNIWLCNLLLFMFSFTVEDASLPTFSFGLPSNCSTELTKSGLVFKLL